MEGETLFCFTIGNLRDLLVQEGVYLQALRGPVDELIKLLTKMEELLEYARVRRDKRTAEIIELADHLIDSVETYVFKALSGYMGGIRERFLRPKLVMAIEKITTKVNEFVNSQSGVQSDDGEAPRREYIVQDLSGFIENDFVGREEDINKLVSFLVDEESEQFRVVSLYGMGGLGKTTLARKVYKDKKVLSHFQSFAFVCVSEQCQAEAILKHILQQLLPEKNEEIKGMTDGDVIVFLQKVQGEKKCLVVIDDVWSVNDWDRLNRGLPGGCTGSKILLTTRIKDVADKGFCYSLPCFSVEECWNLCLKTIFTSRDPEVAQRMEELGKKMIAWCRGIPLAVLVLRGVLVTKYTLGEWERFYQRRTWRVKEHEQFKGEIVQELLFSYKELPYPLRPCFLYLANFQEDEEIEPEMLYRLWEAEGMILSKDRKVGETMMDVGERYLGELVGRNMVEAELDEEVDPSVRRRYKLCQVHDLLRELCLSIVNKENFLKVHDHRGSTEDKVVVLKPSCQRNDIKIPARHSFYFAWDKEFSVDGKQEATQHVRSLMIEEGRARKLVILKKLNLLRVLSLQISKFEEVEFEELIHLRYFSLRWCGIRKFPSSMDNLMYLQTLDLQQAYSFYLGYPDGFSIPKLAMKKLKRLRHLFLPQSIFYKVMPKFSKLRLDGLTKLETLVNFDSSKCETKDVIQLKNLRRLTWIIEISSEDDAEELKGVMSKLNLDPSRHSSLEIFLSNPEIEIYKDVMRGQLPEQCKEILHNLVIIGKGGKLSPEFSNFRQLTHLTLRDFEVEEDPMPTLEKLSNLKDLTFQFGELKRKEMACSTMGFPRLESLFIRNLKNWEKWRVEEGAMPNLRRLWIIKCESLEMLPDELRFITSLEWLSIQGMPEEFTRRLIGRGVEGEEGQDFYKIRHVHMREIIVK